MGLPPNQASASSKACDDRVVIAPGAPHRAVANDTGAQGRSPTGRHEQPVAMVRNAGVTRPAQRLRGLPARMHGIPAAHKIELGSQSRVNFKFSRAGRPALVAAPTDADVEVTTDDHVTRLPGTHKVGETVEDFQQTRCVSAASRRHVDTANMNRLPFGQVPLAGDDPSGETADVEPLQVPARHPHCASPSLGPSRDPCCRLRVDRAKARRFLQEQKIRARVAQYLFGTDAPASAFQHVQCGDAQRTACPCTRARW
jgi:hypothetical protein